MFWACLVAWSLRWLLVHRDGTSRSCGGCCSTMGPGLVQLMRNGSAAGAQRGLLWVGGSGSRSRALPLLVRVCGIGRSGRGSSALLLLQLLLRPWGCSIGGGRSRALLLLLPWGCSICHGGRGSGALLLLQLRMLVVVCVIGHGSRGSGALPLLQLLVPPVGCNIGRSALATLCACLVGGIIRQWGLAERCLTRPLLSTQVLRCLRLPVGPVGCSWRRSLPRVSLPLLLAGGLWGMGWSLDLLVNACCRAGGLGSRTLPVLHPVWSLWGLRIGNQGGAILGPLGLWQHAPGLAGL